MTISFTRWMLASVLVAAALGALMAIAWRLGMTAPWAGAYGTSLAVSVALTAAVLQRGASERERRIEVGRAALRAVALYKEPFERLMVDADPSKFEGGNTLMIDRIDEYKGRWESSSWGIDLMTDQLLSYDAAQKLKGVMATGDSVRSALARMVNAIHEESPSAYDAAFRQLRCRSWHHLLLVDGCKKEIVR